MTRKIEVKKRGNWLGISIFTIMIKCRMIRVAYLLLYPVSFYYLLFDKDAVNGATAYVTRRFPNRTKVYVLWCVYRLFISQGRQLIDRVANVIGAKFNFSLQGRDAMMQIAQSDKGAIMLTAHVGNWQIALETLKEIGKTVYLVMRPEDNEALQQALKISEGSEVVKIISPEGHLGGVLDIVDAINQGGIVSFMGDRPYNFETVDVDYLGDKAAFPYGPFAIAALVGIPVMTLLVAKKSLYEYQVDVSQVMYPKYERGEAKKAQLKVWVQQYADILVKFVKKYPLQCFLFQDVWKK